MHPLAALNDLESYRTLFTDVTFWMPFVREVCQRHNLLCKQVRTAVPGTCPVFIVDDRWVVKFFGRLFDGEQGFAAERGAAQLVALDPQIRAARVVAEGELGSDDWPWPYLIFEYIPGASLGEGFDRISPADMRQVAAGLGETVRRLHALPLAGAPVFPNAWEPYLQFLANQRSEVTERHQKWGSLPARLVAQIDSFLPPVEALTTPTHPPHLIHADLTRDHVLGRFEGAHWRTLAIIDFGDARTGDLLYELCALHLDCFSADTQLLAAFLDAYGLPSSARENLPPKALATALLHQFDVFSGLPHELLESAARLEDLAIRLWGVQ